MRVEAPPADDVAAGRRQRHLAAAGEQRPGQQDRGADPRAEFGIEIGGADVLGVDRERVARLPFGRGADRADQFDQRLGVADARHVLQRDRMLGEQRGGDDRQRRVLVAGRLDRAREPVAAFNDVLNGRHGLRPASHVDVGAERIVLDEFAARLDHVAHQLGEDVVGLVDLLDLHLQQRARVGVERGFPELARGSSRRGLCSAAASRPCGRRRSPPRTGRPGRGSAVSASLRRSRPGFG